MIIGAFAATVYGSSRVTHDIDMVVDLNEAHIRTIWLRPTLHRATIADPEQIRDSIRHGIMFNIIDTSRGEKADLTPIDDGRNLSARFPSTASPND